MSSVLAHAQVLMAESAVESRSAAEDHADARLQQLDKRHEAQSVVLERTERRREALQEDRIALKGKKENKFIAWIGKSRDEKLEDIKDEMGVNHAVATEAVQKQNLIEGDQKDVFEGVKDANERVSETVGHVQETLRAVDEAREEGGLT